MTPRKSRMEKNQLENFGQAARALGCDESEERFDAALKRVAEQKPLGPKSGPKKDAKKEDSK
jgi:hypothetical protein